jgi:hypothetical protein
MMPLYQFNNPELSCHLAAVNFTPSSYCEYSELNQMKFTDLLEHAYPNRVLSNLRFVNFSQF